MSRLSDIVEGLRYLEAHYWEEWGIASLAVPPLGCGHGQLEWRVVGPTLYRHLSRLDIPVELYAPHGTPAEQMDEAFLAGADAKPLAFGQSLNGSRVSPAAVALVAILSRINRETYHWPIGRTTFQKIAYFATESGIPTGLHYQRGSYGPFAANLKQLVSRLVNHQLVAETKRGQMFEIKPGPTYRDAREVCKPQLKEWVSVIEHVADLFLRLPRPRTRRSPPRCISRRKSWPATAGSARARSTCSMRSRNGNSVAARRSTTGMLRPPSET